MNETTECATVCVMLNLRMEYNLYCSFSFIHDCKARRWCGISV